MSILYQSRNLWSKFQVWRDLGITPQILKMSCPEDCLPPWVFLSTLKSSCVGSSLVGGLFFLLERELIFTIKDT